MVTPVTPAGQLFVVAFIAWRRPQELMIEGGATAFATLYGLGRCHFSLVGRQAPGVVRMQADDGLLVTLKPGSYVWK